MLPANSTSTGEHIDYFDPIRLTAASVKPFCYMITGMGYQRACQSCNWQYTLRTLRARMAARAEISAGGPRKDGPRKR